MYTVIAKKIVSIWAMRFPESSKALYLAISVEVFLKD